MRSISIVGERRAEWILNELTDISQETDRSLEEWFAEYRKNFVSKGMEKFEDEFRKVNPKYWNLLSKTLLLVRDPQPILDIISRIVSTQCCKEVICRKILRCTPKFEMYAKIAFLMLPYLMAIIGLIEVSRKATVPAGLLNPYRRQEKGG